MEGYFEIQLLATAIKNAKAQVSDSISNIYASQYPEFLYKYRECKDNAFSLISGGYLWAAKPKEFDDPTDSLVALSTETEICKIEKWLNDHIGEVVYYLMPPIGMAQEKNGYTLASFIQEQKNLEGELRDFSEDSLNDFIEYKLSKLSTKERAAASAPLSMIKSADFEKHLTVAIEQPVLSVANALRDSIYITSLTEKKDNSKMWETYADTYAGFVIEYDVLASIKGPVLARTIQSTFPITYLNERPPVITLDLVQSYFSHVLYGVDFSNIAFNASMLHHALYKREEYREEKEWRVISSQNKISAPVISAVYAGYKISPENERRLKEICEAKHIPLFKQEINRITGKMTFNKIDTGDTI